MSDFNDISIHSEADFLAHVIALKHESEERLQTMADCLYVHNNPDAADVFQELATNIATAIEALESRAEGIELPVIAPWEYQWHCSNNPDSQCMDQAHYMMSSRQALQLALFNEQRSLAFFKRIEDSTQHDAVRVLAGEQVAVEQRFAELVISRMNDLPLDDRLCDDLDPPHMPE
jgi:hypothetical protein